MLPKAKHESRQQSMNRPEASPSETNINNQNVKNSAVLDKDTGFDTAKVIHGRTPFLRVDTLALVLRVFVTAASVAEREGGKKLLKRVKKMAKAVLRVDTIWVDGGLDGNW